MPELDDTQELEDPTTVTRPDGIRVGYGAGTILCFDQLGDWLLDDGYAIQLETVVKSTKPNKRTPGPVRARKR